MSGLIACFSYHASAASVAAVELKAIGAAMLPQDEGSLGVWVSDDKRIGLGQRTLTAMLPRDPRAQPLALFDNKYRIVFHGRIYNKKELKENLSNQGRLLTSDEDTEVLLHLYDRDGPEMVHHLRGMFAFVIWDEEKKGVFAARDALGLKPLYVADDGKSLRFCTQVKPFLNSDAINRSMDPAGHVGFFMLGYVPEPHTLYAGIRALEAGAMLWFNLRGERWKKHFFSRQDSLASGTHLPHRLGETVNESLNAHLATNESMGVLFSGGVNSAVLCALASEQRTILSTLTLAPREPTNSGKLLIHLGERMAGTYDTDHRTITISKEEFCADLSGFLKAMDQPSVAGLSTYLVARAAQEARFKVVLSGVGGDELFGGCPTFKSVPRLVKVMRFVPLARLLGERARMLTGSVARVQKTARLFELGTRIGDAYLLRRGLYMPWELSQFLDPGMVEAGLKQLDLLSRLNDTPADIKNWRLRVLALEMSWRLQGQLLRDADWAGLAHGLEIRMPLVDALLIKHIANNLFSLEELASLPATALPREIVNKQSPNTAGLFDRWLSEIGPPNDGGLRVWAQKLYAAFI